MISAIILAAGKSVRMGKCKQLLILNGQTIIEHVIENISASKVDEIIVVLGFKADIIKEKIKRYHVKAIVNDRYELGMSTSLKAGLRILNKKTEAALFILGDQPYVEASTINKLILNYEKKKPLIAVPVHKGRRGNPVLIDRTLFDEIKKISGDTGARTLIKKHKTNVLDVEVETPNIFIDIDTEDEFELEKENIRSRKKLI